MERTGIQRANLDSGIKSTMKLKMLGIFAFVILTLSIVFVVTRLSLYSMEKQNIKMKTRLSSLSNDMENIKLLSDKKILMEERVKSVGAIPSIDVSWSEMILNFSEMMPVGITLLSIEGVDSQVTMQCISKDQITLAEFIKNLENDEDISDVRLIDINPVEGHKDLKFGVYFKH